MASLFDRILSGEIPSHRIYEDEHVFAFLDIAPLSPGHALLIPKQAARTLDELSDEQGAALGKALPKIARALKKLTGVAAYNVLQNNESEAHQAVFHVHFHLIPKPNEHQGLGIHWPATSLDHAAASLFAGRMRAELGCD